MMYEAFAVGDCGFTDDKEDGDDDNDVMGEAARWAIPESVVVI